MTADLALLAAATVLGVWLWTATRRVPADIASIRRHRTARKALHQ